jgi:hypothetical protein
MSDAEPVILTMVMGTFAAETVVGALEAAGVPAMTRPEQHGGWLFPGSGGGFGLVAVLVPPDRLEEAREILAACEECAEDAGPHPGGDETADEEDDLPPDDEDASSS